MTEDTTWLTPDAHQRLIEELQYLETEGRADAADRLAEARSHGDIRENADYEAAKDEQGLLEARIRKIRRLLDQAEISTPEATERVEIGCVVTLSDEDGSEMELFVAPTENKVPGYVLASPTSPIGRAVLGAEVGEVVSYEAPSGTFRVTVRGVRPFNG
ncbi:MAG: GreA/GreB family elongation factor [Acidimicrobiia bacterium]